MQPQLFSTALGHTLPHTGKPAESSPVGRCEFGAPTPVGLDHLVTAVRVCVTSSGVFTHCSAHCVFTYSYHAEHSSGAYCVSVLDTVAIVASINVRCGVTVPCGFFYRT
jgi:hypothetical protein